MMASATCRCVIAPLAASASVGVTDTTPGCSMAARCASSISRTWAMAALAKAAPLAFMPGPPNTGTVSQPGKQSCAVMR